MALEGHLQIGRIHPAPIVTDCQPLAAAILEIDEDLGSPGIDGILHELLDNARRSLDHLARSDPVHNIARQLLDN